VTVLHRYVLPVAAALTLAGCSTAPTPDAASSPAAHSPSTATPTTAAASSFCLDLPTFNVAVLAFTADAGRAIEGEQLDVEELRRKAAIVAEYGRQMRDSAPPDVADEFDAVLDAVATSARRMEPGAKVRDIVDPLYGSQARPAFDAVQNYECR
jgi:hypothetical protein